MAKTFDVSDPAQFEDYLRESLAQMALYGNLYIQWNTGAGKDAITILNGAELAQVTRQPEFMLAMDDGSLRPVPAPGGGL